MYSPTEEDMMPPSDSLLFMGSDNGNGMALDDDYGMDIYGFRSKYISLSSLTQNLLHLQYLTLALRRQP